MSVRKQDATGKYKPFDFKTNQFYEEDEYPINSNIGQVEHQLTHTNKGRLIDHDKIDEDIIDNETGLAIIDEDEEKVRKYIKSSLSIDNFCETYRENSHEALLRLLAIQDNKRPLKKGGIGIAYRTDTLIMHCKMDFTAEENVLFDATLGMISSYPENKTYIIKPSDYEKFSKYGEAKTLRAVFSRGAKRLENRRLRFDGLGPDGRDDISISMFDVCRYHRAENGEMAYVEVLPSEFLKTLALCSGIVHGAFGSLEVIMQLSGKYTIAIYWYLENMKNYKEYPTATPGIFEISIKDFIEQFSVPTSYKKNDIDRRVLGPAKESINAIEDCDFTFDYEAKYEGKIHLGYKFIIKKKSYIENKQANIIEEKVDSNDELFNIIKTLVTISGLEFNDKEIANITLAAKRNNKTGNDMMQVITVFKQRLDNNDLEKIEDKVAYICSLIQNNVSSKNNKSKNTFNDFEQRNYDMSELEQILLNNN